MNDAILLPNDKKEALSRAYVSAVVAGAGYTVAVQDFDRDGVDVQIRAGGDMRPSLDLQLKASVHLKRGDDNKFHYPLRRRNYELLRKQSLVPRILVVLDLPAEKNHWVSVSIDKLVMRRCAYWVHLLGLPESTNKETVSVTIYKKNRFDIKNLKNLMDQAGKGVLS